MFLIAFTIGLLVFMCERASLFQIQKEWWYGAYFLTLIFWIISKSRETPESLRDRARKMEIGEGSYRIDRNQARHPENLKPSMPRLL